MPEPTTVGTVTPSQAYRSADGVCLLDVREPDEWEAGHVAGSLHIPLADLPARIAELPRDRSLIAICRVGSRSAHAAAFLAYHGYDVMNLVGGLQAWETQGLPLVTSAGRPGSVF